MGWVRLTHPFPSVLDGIVVAAFALLAGGGAPLALRAGVGMTLLQLGIGTTNDLVDAPSDAGLKAGKPIPAGLVRPDAARGVAVACFAAGVILAASVGLFLAALSGIVIGIGLLYDLRLKGTAWSWLPFAVGIPILPVYGWIAARGGLAPAFAILLPAAVAGGAALAIANSLVDVERDIAAGRTSIAARLGRHRASRVQAVLLLGIAVAVAVTVVGVGGTSWAVPVAPLAAAGAAAVAIITAVRVDWAERGWQAEAVLLAIAAVAWAVVVLD